MITRISDDEIKKPLSDSAKNRIKQASLSPIVYDDDCPELTDKELSEFKRVETYNDPINKVI